MGIEGVGSSVVIALAAVLWLVYLIPTWFRRREYVSTERNAVRLQQTIRIMAETAEVPETVRLEADARTVAEQEKLVRAQFERDQAVAEAKAAAQSRAATRTLAALTPSIAAEAVMLSPAARRLRRARAMTSSVLLTALLAAGMSFTPIAAGVATVVLTSAGVIAVVSACLLVRMAAVARTRAGVARALRERPQQQRTLVITSQPVEPPTSDSGWTPVPVPLPLYLARPAPQPVVSQAALGEARERVLAEAVEKHRAELARERAEKVTPIRPAATTPSRYARMGFVEASDTSTTDLDAALRRRRAV